MPRHCSTRKQEPVLGRAQTSVSKVPCAVYSVLYCSLSRVWAIWVLAVVEVGERGGGSVSLGYTHHTVRRSGLHKRTSVARDGVCNLPLLPVKGDGGVLSLVTCASLFSTTDIFLRGVRGGRWHSQPYIAPTSHCTACVISQVMEFIDSFVMVLRKKTTQLSFLHLYHHSTMFPIWWIGVNW
jgi:hypothetical protein